MRLTMALLAVVAGGSLIPMTPAQAATIPVAMAHYAFSPASITINVGDTLTWTNSDTAPHDVTTTSGPVPIHSATLTTGQSWSYTFTTPGTYRYICSIHPDMQASVTVLAPKSSPPARVVTPAPSVTTAPVTTAPVTTAPVTTAPLHHVQRVVAVPSKVPTPSTHSAPAMTQPSAPTTAAASVQTQAPSLRPLLLVAGLVAAIAVFCLLLIASRAEGDDRTG